MPIHGYPGGVITANPVAPTASVATGVWTTEQQLQAVSQGNWPGYEYPISRSLRLNSADSANLTRTFSAGSQTTWTLSMWFKRGAFNAAAARDLFTVNNGTSDSTYFVIAIRETDKLRIEGFNTNFRETTQVLRDVSAWYHLVVTVDTNNATAANRIRMYLNGVEITAFSVSNNPSLGQSLGVNQAATHKIGALTSTYFDGYMTEINFIAGQALTPSSFGLNDPETGVWSPKAYTGSYSGTNSFYINFSDNSGTTSTTLGKDYSSNGNNWTPNNFSVTAGAGNDSLVDSPTAYGTDTGVGGEVRGNYCTLNPLDVTGTITVSNGNLQATASSDVNTFTVRGTFGVSLGSWYWECVKLVTGDTGASFGIMSLSQAISGAPTGCYGIRDDGNKVVNGSYSAFGSSFTTATVGLAFNATSGTLEIFLNNVSQGTISSIPAGTYAPFISDTSTGAGTNAGGIANFGQRAFAYTAPSGFKALCTQNLPTPTIGSTSTTQAGKYFNPVLYTGTGSAQSITGVGFQPDFVWIKGRSFVSINGVVDAVRGRSKDLYTNLTYAEETSGSTEDLTSFDSDGFSLGTVARFPSNNSGQTFVAWNWKANGAGSSNTAGTITSTVSASTTSGFSIVTYTGNGVSGATIGHGLGVAPSFYIVKNRNTANKDWECYHISLGNTKRIRLNQTAAADTGGTMWANTTPTSTVFSVGVDADVNQNTYTYVAYCFAPVAGYSAFGSYTGNGSTDGPFVYLGFRPAFVLWKRSDVAESWWINDIDRLGYNGANRALFPNLSNAEDTANNIDILSNGFKIRGSGGEVNASGGTYIYACFAENPFKYSLAR